MSNDECTQKGFRFFEANVLRSTCRFKCNHGWLPVMKWVVFSQTNAHMVTLEADNLESQLLSSRYV